MDKQYFYILVIGLFIITVNCILMSSYLLTSVDERSQYNQLPLYRTEKKKYPTDPSKAKSIQKSTILQNVIQTRNLKANALYYLDYYFSKIRAHYSHVNRSVQKLIGELKIKKRSKSIRNAWRIAAEWSNTKYLLPYDSESVSAIIHDLKNVPVSYADIGYKGTQLKMTLTLRGMQRAIFKPKWYSLEDIVQGSVYSGADRHSGEVVSFYLSRLLGMNNVPISTIRHVSLRNEILPVASKKLSATFITKDGKTCFYGVCYFCHKENFVCDEGIFLEGAIILWLPNKLQLASLPYPWARTYKQNKSSGWQIDEDYCGTLMAKPYYLDDHSYRLLQLINLSIFDFLIQNGDRHHYNVLSGEANTPLVMLDNGKSFGDPYTDRLDILAPLLQCCVVSQAVYNRLILLSGGGLSLALRKLFIDDVPLLTDAQFEALDRRVSLVLAAVRACGKVKGDWNKVFR